MLNLVALLNQIDDVMYFPLLVVVMAIAGLYFTFKTKGVQIRLFGESLRILLEPPDEEGAVSSLQAMLVSTASRVGTGNIIGVSTAICLGGPGACFWMWVMCIVGASSAFIEYLSSDLQAKRPYRPCIWWSRILYRRGTGQTKTSSTVLHIPHHHICSWIQYAVLL